MEQVKLLPYGISDFIELRKQNRYYVDKTMYIPKLETRGNFLFIIRPRRFGKSLFLNMLSAYYDSKCEGRFEEIFGGLWIGDHPTPLRGKFQIMHLDFSLITGNIENLETRFNEYMSMKLGSFMDKYSDAYPQKTIDAVANASNAATKLNIIADFAKERGTQIYLILDEYDNFTNNVLNEKGEAVYTALTHASGFYRDIFKIFKVLFTRIFMIGVSPVTLDDLTSGFNIALNLSTDYSFNQMLGFSTEDVREMMQYYQNTGMLPGGTDVEATIEAIKPWYDNYCFSEDALENQSRVFNSDMVLYYLDSLVNNKRTPRNMVDPNTKTDYGKMKKLLQLDKLDGDRKSVICKIAEQGEIIANIEDSFPARMLVKPNIFTSLLFYYGMLTYKEMRGDLAVLGIPNNNVRKQYYEYLKELYDEKDSIDTTTLANNFYSLAYEGEWRPLFQFLSESYARVSSVRDGIDGERNLQGFFMAYLSINNYYILAPELEMSHGYCDFFLLPDHSRYKASHSYIIELKMLKKGEWTEARAQKQWDDAVEQIKRYAVAPRVEALRQGTALHLIILQFEGWELRRMEAVEN